MIMRDLPARGAIFLLVGLLVSAGAAPPQVHRMQREGPQDAPRAAAAKAVAGVMAGVEARHMWNTTVVVKSATGHGTGVIIAPGRVLTAYHVVEQGAPEIEFFGGEQLQGRVGWSNGNLDLAVVSVPMPLRYRASAIYCGALDQDQKLIAIGHPLKSRWVSVEGSLRVGSGFNLGGLLPLSFDLSLGNSGGPVFDDAGRVVGIASAILIGDRLKDIAAKDIALQGLGHTGIGLMLPANLFCAELSAI